MSELKRCMTCGNEDIDPSYWMVKKDDQFPSGPGCPVCGTTAESIGLWNQRPLEDKLVEALTLAHVHMKCYLPGYREGHNVFNELCKILEKVKG